ncbi:MFS transporter [Spirosoma areae]
MASDAFRRELLELPAQHTLTSIDHKAFLIQYGKVDAIFKLSYAFGFLLMGWFIDKIGVRLGYAAAIFLWVISAMMHSTITSFTGLSIVRFTLGFGEAGNYPSAIKTVAEWFPVNQQSKAVGIFNSGANLGIIITAAIVPMLLQTFGWRQAFLVTSSLGLLLFVCWLVVYRNPPAHLVTTSVNSTINSNIVVKPDIERVNWFKLLNYRQTWAFALGKLCTDLVWFFYLGFLPDFFYKSGNFNLDLKSLSLPFIFIFLMSDAGSIFFGWLSAKLMSMGWSQNKARKFTLLLCSCCPVPVVFASLTTDLSVAVLLIALAAAGHQGWSTNLFSIVLDLFPQKAVASVSGIGGMFGAIGGVLFSYNAGNIVANFGYVYLFLVPCFAYLFALMLIQLLSRNLIPVRL